MKYPDRLRATVIALDQLLAAVITGWPDATLSAWAWAWERDGKRAWPRILIDGIALHIFRDPNHCEESYTSERTGLQLPPELRRP